MRLIDGRRCFRARRPSLRHLSLSRDTATTHRLRYGRFWPVLRQISRESWQLP